MNINDHEMLGWIFEGAGREYKFEWKQKNQGFWLEQNLQTCSISSFRDGIDRSKRVKQNAVYACACAYMFIVLPVNA